MTSGPITSPVANRWGQCGNSVRFHLLGLQNHYLRLLIFLLAILIPACASSSPMFLMMYSAYKLIILKEMGIPDHLTCLLRNLYAGQEATARIGHGTTDWFQIGKGVCQGCILSSCLFNFYAENIMRNIGLEEATS